MIPILDCNNLTYLFKLIRPPKTEDQLYKGNLKRKKKRDKIEREKERLRGSFIHLD